MTDNTQRFTGRAADYDRYRQRYPTQDVLRSLRTWCGLTPGWLVADIGAGTGMLAEVFLENGNPVLAVEPNPEMRAVCEQLQPQFPRLQVIDATAEATSLADASIDLIAVGRAFHWFDKEKSLAEFRRILRPGGWVTLVAIDRSREEAGPLYKDQVDAFEHLMMTHGTDYVRVRSGYRTYNSMENLFDGELHQQQLHGAREVDWETFRGHALSLSVTPTPGHEKYDGFQQAARAYFDTFARNGVLTIPTTCWITAARFAHP
jgi:ubiquinone/menaquinone biosynthesis C-methylase UbiE